MTYKIFDIFREKNKRYSIFYNLVLKTKFKNILTNDTFTNDSIYIKWLYNKNDTLPSKLDFYYLANLIKDFYEYTPEKRFECLYSKNHKYIYSKKLDGKTVNLSLININDNNDNILFAFIEQISVSKETDNNLNIQIPNITKNYLKDNNIIIESD
jgi:hypothetical protein